MFIVFVFTISCVPKAEAQLSSVCPTSSMKFTSKAARESRKVNKKKLYNNKTRLIRMQIKTSVITTSFCVFAPPVSMASIRASVSLLRIQSMSCRCDLSPELSRRRRPGIRPVDPAVDLGSAFRPSNRSTSRRSTSRMVSSTQRSSPPRADSIESGSAERNRS